MTNVYTADEVARHAPDCEYSQDRWIVIHGNVYDITQFQKEHPGGEEVLEELAGQDATECFDSVGHSNEALLLREKYKIGELVVGTSTNQSKVEQKINAEIEEEKATRDKYAPPKKETSFRFFKYASFFVIIYAIIIYYILF